MATSRAGRCVAVLGICYAVTWAPARADDAGPAKYVAADAAIYAEMPRPGPIVDRLTGDGAVALIQAVPAYARALESKEVSDLYAVVEAVAERLEMPWRDAVRDLTAGGITLAVEAVPGTEARGYLIITPRDGALLKKAHDALLELARENARSNGRPDPVKQAEYRGLVGYSVQPKEAHAIVGGSLVITNGGDAMKAWVDRVKDGMKGPSLADSEEWKARKASLDPDASARGFVRLDRLREVDPGRFKMGESVDPGATLLFGPWLETLRKAPWLAGSMTWTDARLGAELTMPNPEGGHPSALKTYLPGEGQGAPPSLRPPGTIASINLWRNLAAIWEVRTDLFPPEFVQGLSQLDTVAGQFFGGRDFGGGVLGALASDWRVVVAEQDVAALKPAPDLKLPAFALVVGLRAEDDDFAQRLKVAFQSFIGLANLGAAQTKAPPLELGSETVGDVTIATSRFMPPKTAAADGEPVHYRHNFSPSAVQVGDAFVISSSVGLARDLVKELRKGPGQPSAETLRLEADGTALARLIVANRERLVMQNMLDKGNAKGQAEDEVDTLAMVLRSLGRGTLTVKDAGPDWRARLDFSIGKAGK